MKKSKNLTTGVLGDEVKNHLRTAYSVDAEAKLTIDWNWNRYASPVATNTPSEDEEGFDIEAFPIESIVEPLRPTKGVTKAIIGQAVVSPGYVSALAPRFYTGDRDDIYKYWTAPYKSDGTGAITDVKPRVTYDRVVKANKIVIKLENTWASPANWSIHISTTQPAEGNATTFPITVQGSSVTIANDGTVTLYYNGTSWVGTRPATLVSTNLYAIELRVTSLGPGIMRDGIVMGYLLDDVWTPTTGANSNFNLIAIEAYLEADLTDRLLSVSDVFDFSDRSQLYPIGTITTNTAEITLANEDGIFNPENTSSPYYGLIEPNALFDLSYIFNINGVQHSVQQFKMYGGPWNNSDGETSITLEDYSKFLKEIKPRAFMIENKTSTELVWRVLDSVGFVNYGIQNEDIEDSVVPVFWTDGEQTVWEVLDELAQATQTAIYFDENGRLQVRTREAAFSEDETVDWNLLAVQDGTSLPDIIEWNPSGELEANKIEVRYQDAKWKFNSQGQPVLSKVWEPDGDSLVVRSGALRKTFDEDDTLFFIDQKDILYWPFEGKVQVDGEIMEYEGKQFVYFTYTTTYDSQGRPSYTDETKNVVIVKDADEAKKKHRLTPGPKRHKNHYTGAFKITKRGLWNTDPAVHSVDLNGWDAKAELNSSSGGTIKETPKGLKHDKKNSLLHINTPPMMKDADDIFWAVRGGVNQTGYKVYGTRLKFNKDEASTTQIAGMMMHLSGDRESGYYVEVKLSSSLDAKKRKVSSEISLYSRVGGKLHLLDRGRATAIGKEIWYDIDVYRSDAGAQHKLAVFVNGHKAAEATTNATTKHAGTGRFGLFAKGKTNVSFEYIYAVNYDNISEPIDDYGFYDLKYGGVRGNRWLLEYVWSTRSRHKEIIERPSEKEKKKRRNKYVFDEFGPYVHEVREFDVKFEPNPVRFSYLFNTNEWYSSVIQYVGDPFGAKFVIVNTARENAVLHGEDNLIYAGASSGVNQVCVAIGQVLELSDEETITRKNESAILARGEITVELANRWIQSKAMARAIAKWMHNHWSEAVDEVEVTLFGNPLLELGDLVDVDYPDQNATPATHQYWVTSISTAFENGITTSVTLRRRRQLLSPIE